jgi:hypothetical protein
MQRRPVHAKSAGVERTEAIAKPNAGLPLPSTRIIRVGSQ